MGTKADATKSHILDIAITEFAERGFDGARINMIAEKAEINKERIYAYFDSKEGLYAAAVDEAYGRIIDVEERLLSLGKNDALELTRTILSLYFEFYRDHPEFTRILGWENLSGANYALNFGLQRKRVFNHLAAIYSAGQDRGIFAREVSFEAYIFALTATSFFYSSNMKTMSRTLSLDLANQATAERMVQELEKLLAGNRRGEMKIPQ